MTLFPDIRDSERRVSHVRGHSWASGYQLGGFPRGRIRCLQERRPPSQGTRRALRCKFVLFLALPSFFLETGHDGKTFDPGFVSINTLVGSGFDDQNVLWIDIYCRRSGLYVGAGDNKERFLPVKHVDKSLLALRIEWAKLVLRSTTATILVIFGRPNSLYLEKLWQDRLEEAPLWDRDQTKFCILWDEDDEPNRLVFFLWHPEYLTQRKDPDTGKRYDEQLAAIARMAGIGQSAE